jgi:hypothetical protein
VPDPAADAAFVVYDRKLERRSANGKIESLGPVDIGFESLVVSKTLAAYVTSSFPKTGGTKITLHVLDRGQSWREARTVDLSTSASAFKHPLVAIADDTFAVGRLGEVIVVAANGTQSSVGGATTPLATNEVFSLFPTSEGGRFFAQIETGPIFAVETKTNTVTAQPPLEGLGQGAGSVFDARTNTWVTTDFDGIKINTPDGKLLRKVDLVTAKQRFISSSAFLPDGSLLVTYPTEASQERSVMATYDLHTLSRKELGTFDGIIDQLGAAKSQILFAFSPKGAGGFNSRVWYAHALGI